MPSQKKPMAVAAGEKKKRRFHPGTVARREVRKQQTSTKNNIARASLRRVINGIVRDVAEDQNIRAGVRLSGDAAAMMHTITEAMLTDAVMQSLKLMVASGRVQLMARDLETYLKTLPVDHILVDDSHWNMKAPPVADAKAITNLNNIPVVNVRPPESDSDSDSDSDSETQVSAEEE